MCPVHEATGCPGASRSARRRPAPLLTRTVNGTGHTGLTVRVTAKIVAAATPFHIKRVFVMSDEPPRTAWWRGLKRILKRNHSMELIPEYDVPALHAFNDSLATYLAGLALLHKAKAHVIAQTDWCQALAAARRAALISRQERQEDFLHALAAALRRVAPHSPERDGVLHVLEEARDGRGSRIARSRLVLQLYT